LTNGQIGLEYSSEVLAMNKNIIISILLFAGLLFFSSCGTLMIYESSDEVMDHSLSTQGLNVMESGSVSYTNLDDIWVFGKIPKEKLLADIVCSARTSTDGDYTSSLFGPYQDFLYRGEIKTRDQAYNIDQRIRVYDSGFKRIEFLKDILSKNNFFEYNFFIKNPTWNKDHYTFPANIAQIENNNHTYTVIAVHEKMWKSIKKDENNVPIDSYARTDIIEYLINIEQKFQFLEDDAVVAELVNDRYIIFENAGTENREKLRMSIGFMHILVNLYENSWYFSRD
jgi:hypothetical protein